MRLALYLLAHSVLILHPNAAEAQVPSEAIEAWNAPAQAKVLLDVDPLRLSNDSFTAEISSNATWEAEETASGERSSGADQSEVFVAKLDNAILISTKLVKRGQEKREIFVDGKYYQLYRGLDASDWMFIKQGEYTLPAASAQVDDNSLLVGATRLQNQNLHALWGFASHSFAKLFEIWQVLDVESSEDRLVVTAKASESNTFTLEFLPQEGFRLLGWEKRIEHPQGSGTEVMRIEDVSPDCLSFTMIEDSKGASDGNKTISRQVVRVTINPQAPDASLFDLASYNLRFRDPLPSGSQYWTTLLPIAIGIVLIVAAMVVKRRAK